MDKYFFGDYELDKNQFSDLQKVITLGKLGILPAESAQSMLANTLMRPSLSSMYGQQQTQMGGMQPQDMEDEYVTVEETQPKGLKSTIGNIGKSGVSTGFGNPLFGALSNIDYMSRKYKGKKIPFTNYEVPDVSPYSGMGKLASLFSSNM